MIFLNGIVMSVRQDCHLVRIGRAVVSFQFVSLPRMVSQIGQLESSVSIMGGRNTRESLKKSNNSTK